VQGGTAALVGAIIVGPRIGRFRTPEKIEKDRLAGIKFNFNPHSVPFVVLGTLILWFGWYGFNCGSTLGITGDNQEAVSRVGMTTTIAAGSGGLASLLMDMAWQYGHEGHTNFVVTLSPTMTNGIRNTPF